MLLMVGLGIIETQGGRETIRTSKSDSPGTCGGVVHQAAAGAVSLCYPQSKAS